MNKKQQLYLTTSAVNLFDTRFKAEAVRNYFSNQYVYFSQNFEEKIHSVYQMIGNLSGVPVNYWEDYWNLTNVFIISTEDYEQLSQNIKSKEVQFVEDFINKKQTKKDSEETPPKLSTDLHIVKYETLRFFIENRNDFNFFSEKVKDFKIEAYRIMSKNNFNKLL